MAKESYLSSRELFTTIAYACLFAYAILFSMASSSLPIAVQLDNWGTITSTLHSFTLAVTMVVCAFFFHVPHTKTSALVYSMLPLPFILFGSIVFIAATNSNVNYILILTAVVALGFADGWLFVRLGFNFAAMERGPLLWSCASSLMGAAVLFTIIINFPPLVWMLALFLVFLLVPVFSLFAGMPLLDEVSQRVIRAHSPRKLNKRYANAGRRGFLAILFLYCLIFGIFRDIPAVTGVNISPIFAMALVAAGLIALIFVRVAGNKTDLFVVQWLLTIIVIVGALLTVLGSSQAIIVSSAVIVVGFTLFDISAVASIAEFAMDDNPAFVFGFGRGLMALGNALGASIVLALHQAGLALSLFLPPVTIGAVSVLVVVMIVSNAELLKGSLAVGQPSSLNTGEIANDTSCPDAEPNAADEDEPEAEQGLLSIKEACALLAVKHDLSPREAQVFELLAHGRNTESIQERLYISKHTVRSHVSHIYTKLDVHSHQELIDYVESYCSRH